jgi:hypothetical protein
MPGLSILDFHRIFLTYHKLRVSNALGDQRAAWQVTASWMIWQEQQQAEEDGRDMIQAANFLDNAPSWEELQQLVEQRRRELNWPEPDLENVRALRLHRCAVQSAEVLSP